MKNTIIISAFPATGKSYLFQNTKQGSILDSDSSKFSWISSGVRHPDFPQNYINHIKDNIGNVNLILVSSHKIVREALVNNNIVFTLVYPDNSLKEEYINRYIKRKNDQNFINILDKNWNNFLEDMQNQTHCRHLILNSGEYLIDRIIDLKEFQEIMI